MGAAGNPQGRSGTRGTRVGLLRVVITLSCSAITLRQNGGRSIRVGCMRYLKLLLLGLWGHVCGVQAGLPDFQAYPAQGERLLLWVASERGRSEPEQEAARKLAEQGVEVWSLDLVNAYFLPQLPSSMDRVPLQDLTDWLRSAQASGKRVTVYAVARAAVPVLRAAAQLEPALRDRLCLLLMYPNLYTVAEPLAEPDFLDLGSLSGLRVKVLQPRRSAATPWLPSMLDHLTQLGATVGQSMLENLRESYWARETPTEFEEAESQRMDAMLVNELNTWECK